MRAGFAILAGMGLALAPVRSVSAPDASAPVTVAVSPIEVPERYPALKNGSKILEGLVMRRLREMGAKIVPPDTVLALQRRVSVAVGGLYDTRTGKPIREHWPEWRQGCRLEMWQRYQPRLWVRPALVIRRVSFSGGTARWDGVEEDTGGEEGVFLLMGRDAGSVPALSLVVSAVDSTGQEVYAHRGGIRLLRHVARDRMIGVPPDSLLTDLGLDLRAVRLAVDSLPSVLARPR